MLQVRDWLAGPFVVALMAGAVWLLCSSSWSAGYQAGVLAQADSLDVQSWGTCTYGYSGWARCARTTGGQLVIVRGMK